MASKDPMKKWEGSKADKKVDTKMGLKEGSKKDNTVDRKMATKLLAKKK